MELRSKTRVDLGWDLLVAALVARTRTLGGAGHARELGPLGSADAVRVRQEEIREARALHDAGQGLDLDGVRDLRAALDRSSKGGTLDAAALHDVALTLRSGARAKRLLRDSGTRA